MALKQTFPEIPDQTRGVNLILTAVPDNIVSNVRVVLALTAVMIWEWVTECILNMTINMAKVVR